jgi:hypothetical protein
VVLRSADVLLILVFNNVGVLLVEVAAGIDGVLNHFHH